MLSSYPDLALSIMAQAFCTAAISHAGRRKTGAKILKQIEGKTWIPVSEGYNGTRKGESNQCEDVYGKTLPNVIHAERNCFIKMLPLGSASKGCTLVVTFVPCSKCVEAIIDAEIAEVIYCQESQNQDKRDSVRALTKAGIHVARIPERKVLEFTKSIVDGLEQEKFMATLEDHDPIQEWLAEFDHSNSLYQALEICVSNCVCRGTGTKQNWSLPALPVSPPRGHDIEVEEFVSWVEQAFAAIMLIEESQDPYHRFDSKNFMQLFEELQ